MIWQNSGYNLSGATPTVKQVRSNLHGFASLCQRARHARLGPGYPNQNPTPPPLDDGQGDSDSTPAC